MPPRYFERPGRPQMRQRGLGSDGIHRIVSSRHRAAGAQGTTSLLVFGWHPGDAVEAHRRGLTDPTGPSRG